MKSVLISIQPKWCELIANGKKTIEVRKTKPKLPTPFKCYIYCTQGGDNLYSVNGAVQKPNEIHLDLKQNSVVDELNGKVIGEFMCDSIAKGNSQLGSCLSMQEISDYANGKEVYGWHISHLVIYDKPKELWDFCHYKKFDWWDYGHHTNKPQWELCSLTRPPQSWCYVYGKGEGE